MKAIKRTNGRIWIFLIVVVVVQVLCDPFSPLLHFAKRFEAGLVLPSARQKWESQNVAHYKFDIKVYMPLVCIVGGNVEVKDGVVIRTGPSSDAGTNHNLDLDAGFTTSDDYFLCNYRNYTIPGLFEELEQWLYSSSPITRITFDPEYGFISGFGFGSSGGIGLLSPTISDCCGGYTIRNFQVLDE